MLQQIPVRFVALLKISLFINFHSRQVSMTDSRKFFNLMRKLYFKFPSH